jgi:hypothetical protein
MSINALAHGTATQLSRPYFILLDARLARAFPWFGFCARYLRPLLRFQVCHWLSMLTEPQRGRRAFECSEDQYIRNTVFAEIDPVVIGFPSLILGGFSEQVTRASGLGGFPPTANLPSKESQNTKIRNPKTQENRDPAPAFLQNLILVQVKSQRSINHFRILHGRLGIACSAIMQPFLDAPSCLHAARTA